MEKVEKSSDIHGIKTKQSKLTSEDAAKRIIELDQILNGKIDYGEQKTNQKNI
jgi:hypothetical protein